MQKIRVREIPDTPGCNSDWHHEGVRYEVLFDPDEADYPFIFLCADCLRDLYEELEAIFS